MKMANGNLVKVVCIFAIILTFIASVLATVGGFCLLFGYSFVYGAGLITMLAGAVLFVTFILGIVALSLKRAEISFACAIISIVCATAITCCLGVLTDGGDASIISMPILAAVFSLTSFALYMIFYLYTPSQSAFIKIKQYEFKASEMRCRLKRLNDSHEFGHISDEQYSAESVDLLKCAKAYDMQAKELANAKPTKKKKVCLFAVPVSVMCLLIAIITPSVYFGVCNYAYEGLIRQMADAEYGLYCVHYADVSTFDSMLPDYYKDVRAIRDEMNAFNLKECQLALLGNYRFSEKVGNRARVAYKRLLELQEYDSRWGFETLTRLKNIMLWGAEWQSGDVYFQIILGEIEWEYTFDTNLPNTIPDGEEKTFECYSKDEYPNDGITFGYMEEANSLNKYPSYKITDLSYDLKKDEFSIELYCIKTQTAYTLTCSEQYKWNDFEWNN